MSKKKAEIVELTEDEMEQAQGGIMPTGVFRQKTPNLGDPGFSLEDAGPTEI